MNSADKLEQLRQSQLLQSAPDSVVRKVADIVETTSIKAGETLFNKGESGTAMYIITEGRVRVHDSDLTLCYLESSNIFGEMAALADDEVRSASITAEENSTLLQLEREALFDLLSREPEVAKAIIHSLCRREKHIIDDVTRRSHKVRSLEHELEIGRKIQAGFLPDSLPQVPGWEIAAYFHAAREVAGDFYDSFVIPGDGRIALVVGDVCGKGVGAALFMTLFRSLIRATLLSGDLISWATAGEGSSADSPKREPLESRPLLSSAVSLTNNYIARNHSKASMFASLFLALLEPDSGSLTYINCGHEAPIIFNNKGVRSLLDPTGPVVGMFPGANYAVEHTVLHPDDSLIVYTDGVTEAINNTSEQFSEQRLLALLEQRDESAEHLVTRVITELTTFTEGVDQFDDITLMAVRNTHNGL